MPECNPEHSARSIVRPLYAEKITELELRKVVMEPMEWAAFPRPLYTPTEQPLRGSQLLPLPTPPQILKKGPSDLTRLSARGVKRKKDSTSTLKEDSTIPAAKRKPQGSHITPGATATDRKKGTEEYLQDCIAGFRNAAGQGYYKIASTYCKSAIEWMDKNKVHSPQMYALLSQCRDGCEFICDIIVNDKDWEKRWLSTPDHSRHPLNFLRHVLLDTARIQEPDCEFDIPKILDIFTKVGESKQIHSRDWYIYFHAVSDLFLLKDFIGASPQFGESTLAVTTQDQPTELPTGQLYNHLESWHISFRQAVINNDEAAFDHLTQAVKKHCAKYDFHPHILFEAGALMASVHNQFKRGRLIQTITDPQRKKFQNRLLSNLNDFGLVLFGTGGMELHDIYKSVLAMCKSQLPLDKATELVRSALEYIVRLKAEGKKGDGKKTSTYWKDDQDHTILREFYASHYGRLASNAQDDIDESIEKKDFDKAIDILRELIKGGRLFAGELHLARLQVASCHLKKSDYLSCELMLDQVMNRGCFGIKKAKLLLDLGNPIKALETIEQTKRAYSPQEGQKDLGMYEKEDLLRLEYKIRKKMVTDGMLAKALCPNPEGQADTIRRLESTMEQLKIDNTRLDRRLKAKRKGYEYTVELADKVKAQQKTIKALEEERKSAQSRIATLNRDLQKAEKRTVTTTEGSGSVQSAQAGLEFYKTKTKKYHCEKEQLKKEKAKLEQEVRSLLHRIHDLQQKIDEFQQVLEDKVARAKKSFPKLRSDVSGIAQAGQGLYADEPVQSGTRIGEYIGEKVYRQLIPSTGRYAVWKRESSGQITFLNNDYHTVWIEDSSKRKGQVQEGIDAKNKDGTECPLKLINHHRMHNVKFMVTDDGRIFAFASRDISKGEELFWNYCMIREDLFDLPKEKQDLLKLQDHIEPHPGTYVMLDQTTGNTRLTARARQYNLMINRVWD